MTVHEQQGQAQVRRKSAIWHQGHTVTTGSSSIRWVYDRLEDTKEGSKEAYAGLPSIDLFEIVLAVLRLVFSL